MCFNSANSTIFFIIFYRISLEFCVGLNYYYYHYYAILLYHFVEKSNRISRITYEDNIGLPDDFSQQCCTV